MTAHSPGDIHARLRALDPADSFIVQAPAGSGKTELLIQRYLALLAVVNQPESVVAITFTKKAAGEMRDRVIRALQSAASQPPPDREHERRTWELARRALDRDYRHEWRLIEQPSRLRIQTIDSLCGMLVRAMPWLSRMGAPAPPEEDAEHLYHAAAHATLSLLETSDSRAASLERLLRHLDNNLGSAAGLLAGMLRRRDHWLRHVVPNAPSAEFREQLRQSFQQIIRMELDAVHRQFPRDLVQDTLACARFAAANLSTESMKPLASCGDLVELPGTDPASLNVWLGLAEMFLTLNGARRASLNVRDGFPPTPAGREAKSRCLAIGLPPRLVARMHGLRTLPPGDFSRSQWEVLSALLELLPVAVAQLKIAFREAGKVDFTEVSQASIAALGDDVHPTDLAFAMDCQIQHLLVDEFQDTSHGQYELLKRLTAGWEPSDGRTIFLVGDPMQSIYGFREAEVGLFLRARSEGIGGVRLTPLKLSVNFRSTAGIVNWVNEAVGPAFPEEEDVFEGAVRYERSEAFDETSDGDAVRVHPLFDRTSDEEASRVLAIVREAQQENPDGSIAVLVRSRSHLAAIVRSLQRAGVSYRAVEIDALGERPVVLDLQALTNALLHPGDRPAWLAILRAPWCGLTLADLHALAGEDVTSAVWDLVRDETRVSRLSDDCRARLLRVIPVLASALAQRGRLPLRRWVEATWVALGGPACVEDATGLEDASAYLDLLENSAAGCDLLDPVKFREDVSRLFARPDAATESALQLLTIHKAKGLEFDTVVVPGLGRTTRTDETRLLLWLEYLDSSNSPRLLLAPVKETGAESDPSYAYLQRIYSAKSDHEDTRLLYVAATRARRLLHLLGHAQVEPKTGELRIPVSRTLLSKIWPAVQSEFERALAAGGLPVTAPNEEQKRSPSGVPLRRLSLDWQNVTLPPDVDWRPEFEETVADEKTRKAITFDWATELQRRVGIVVHAMLQRLDSERPEWKRAAIQAALQAQGLTGEDLQEAERRTEAALRATLRDERGRWILARHQDDRREVALSGIVDGRLQHCTLDRTFVDDAGVRWIVDYKTGVHQGGDLEGFLDNEQSRYRNQLESYAQLVSLLDSGPIRLGLYFPLLQAWREWEFDRAASFA
jgi:ATP-dependent exoDNAse (exonuclease V) beta subunit